MMENGRNRGIKSYTLRMRNRVLFSILALILIYLAAGCSGGSSPVTPGPGPGDRPANYTLLFNDKVCRWKDGVFPLLVYIDPPPSDAGSAAGLMMASAANGVEMWDNIITGIPDVFNVAPDEESADIVVRWQDDTDGAYTRVTDYGSYVSIKKIAVSEDIRNPKAIKLLMTHELGHVLGLGHSAIKTDLMFNTLNYNLTSMTDRDIQIIRWLYSQTSYIPIFGN